MDTAGRKPVIQLPEGRLISACQSAVASSQRTTNRVIAPKIRVIHFCISKTVFCPRILTSTVSPPNSISAMAVIRCPLPSPMAVNSAARVRVPVMIFTASQPIRLNQQKAVGAILPLLPKLARERVRVVVRPILPAILVIPTKIKEATPTTAAKTD